MRYCARGYQRDRRAEIQDGIHRCLFRRQPSDSGSQKSKNSPPLEDLKNAKVGAQQATSGESYAKEKGADVVQYEDNELMFSALKTGQVQAVSANLSVISEALTKDPDSFKIAYQTSENADQIAGAVAPEKKAPAG